MLIVITAYSIVFLYLLGYYVKMSSGPSGAHFSNSVSGRDLIKQGFDIPPEVVQHVVPGASIKQQQKCTPSKAPFSNFTLNSIRLISCGNLTTIRSNNSLADSHFSTTIIAITPTYKRLTQKADLVTLCHTVMHVPNMLWIVIEDSGSKSALVENVLHHCNVNSVHLNALTSRETKKAMQRGVEQRNAGLDWARGYCKEKCAGNCSGVIYFMDDDNKYDLRLFEEVGLAECMCGVTF